MDGFPGDAGGDVVDNAAVGEAIKLVVFKNSVEGLGDFWGGIGGRECVEVEEAGDGAAEADGFDDAEGGGIGFVVEDDLGEEPGVLGERFGSVKELFEAVADGEYVEGLPPGGGLGFWG